MVTRFHVNINPGIALDIERAFEIEDIHFTERYLACEYHRVVYSVETPPKAIPVKCAISPFQVVKSSMQNLFK